VSIAVPPEADFNDPNGGVVNRPRCERLQKSREVDACLGRMIVPGNSARIRFDPHAECPAGFHHGPPDGGFLVHREDAVVAQMLPEVLETKAVKRGAVVG